MNMDKEICIAKELLLTSPVDSVGRWKLKDTASVSKQDLHE